MGRKNPNPIKPRRPLPQMKSAADLRDRVSFNAHVIHQPLSSPGDEPKHIEMAWSFFCQTKEEAFERNYTADTDWELIQSPFFDDIGVVVIRNLHGLELQRNPTPEERAEMNDHVIQVSYDKEHWFVVRPFGGGWFAECSHAQELFVRSPNGPCKFKLSLLPR